MTMTIGRAAIRVDKGYPTYSGDRMTVRGHVLPSTDTANSVLATRQQLRGYVDHLDEDTVPVHWTVDHSVDGWYRVIAASVDDRGRAGSGVATAMIELERFGTSFTGVQMETVGSSVTRVNAAGATAAGVWCLPSVATAFDPPAGWKNLALASRTTASGAVHVVGVDTSTTAITGRYTINPSSHYVGAATIEDTFGGSTYYSVAGRHARLAPTTWRLTNDLLRITPSTTAGHLLDVSTYNGTTWSTPSAFTLIADNNVVPPNDITGTDPVLVSARVLRNSVECAVVRLGWRYVTVNGTTVSSENKLLRQTQILDVSLRRGARIVELDVSNGSGSSYGILSQDGTPAGTSITGGVKATAADASGNKAVIMSAGTIAAVPTTMRMRVTGSATFHWAIGYETPSGAAAPHAAADLVQQYVGALAEKQRAVLG